MRIRFLYFRGCPHAETALNLLKEVLREKGVEEEIEIVEIKSEKDAKKYHFLGSPSIQVDSIDIEEERCNSPQFLVAEFTGQKREMQAFRQKK